MDQTITPTEKSHAGRAMRRAAYVLAIGAVVIVGYSVVSARSAAAKLAADATAAAAVTVATVKPLPLADSAVVTLPGNVVATTDAPIYARTSGYLKRWLVDIGTRVKVGQVLAEIDAPELDQQLRGAEADVATAQANQQIAGTTAARYKGLRDTDSVSKQAADEKLSLSDASAAQLKAAQANLQRLRELSGFKRIVAPFDGVITARNTDVGQLITAGSGGAPELFRVADLRRLRLYVRVPQAYAAGMQAGVKAELHFPDRPGRSYEAVLERTANALDAASRTLLVQLLVDNARGELLPGTYAEVSFHVPPDAGVTAFKVPANVLMSNGAGLQVATLSEAGKVVMKDVLMGRDFGADIEIVGGLSAADEVILSPPDSLSATTPVQRLKPKAEVAAR